MRLGRLEIKVHERQDYGRNVPTLARHALARRELTLEDTLTMTDEELLEMPNFGRKCLSWVRETA